MLIQFFQLLQAGTLVQQNAWGQFCNHLSELMILNAFLLKSDPKQGRVRVEHCYTSALKLELWISQGGRAWLSAEAGRGDFV